ncbi:MAG TPA: site-specific integrase [Tepidisphaeraceae bacterium]|nr:site-specific integrase [Tepidisphaeraceae bacterium]
MARLPDGELSRHPVHGFRVTVGRKVDGKPRLFWLGKNEDYARFAAWTYRTGWQQMQACGIKHWTPDMEQRVKETIDFAQRALRDRIQDHQVRGEMIAPVRGIVFPGTTAHIPPASLVEEKPVQQQPAKTLYQAIETYLQTIKGKRISDAHKWRAEQVVGVTLKHAVPDCPMEQIDFAWLDRLADHFKSRPKSRKGKRRNRKPIGPQTVKTNLAYIRQFFVWCDDVTFGGWEGPRKLTKPFRVRLDDLRTPAELRQANTIEQFDLPTLVKIYRAANDYQKAIMLTALFTAGTQRELAVLEKSEFDLQAGVLHHWRNKTKIEGRFWLPPELILLLKEEFKKHRKRPLAFYTAHGFSLVTYLNGKLVSDAVRQMWVDLRVKAQVPTALSFKYLRKFVADFMVRHGGEAIGQIALSHAPTSILAKNYTRARDFGAFNELQRQMYAEFTSAGMFETDFRDDVERIRHAGRMTSEPAKDLIHES